MKVRFSKNGFHHPLYGRLGRGKNTGRVYVLPDAFAEKETIKVPIMDSTSKPPKQVGEKEITRYKHLPSDCEIIDEDYVAELEGQAQEAGEVGEDAQNELDNIKKATRPASSELVDQKKEMDKVTGQGKKPPAQDAKTRTTGATKKRPSRRSPRKAPASAS